MAVKQFLENRDGWDLDEVIDDIVHETKLIKNNEIGELATDECIIKWGDDAVCVLDEFINRYSEIFIENICNILDSFVGEDLSDYEFDE